MGHHVALQVPRLLQIVQAVFLELEQAHIITEIIQCVLMKYEYQILLDIMETLHLRQFLSYETQIQNSFSILMKMEMTQEIQVRLLMIQVTDIMAPSPALNTSPASLESMLQPPILVMSHVSHTQPTKASSSKKALRIKSLTRALTIVPTTPIGTRTTWEALPLQ